MVKTRKQRNNNETKIILSKKNIYSKQKISSSEKNSSLNSSISSKKKNPKKKKNFKKPKKLKISSNSEFEEEYNPNSDNEISNSENSENFENSPKFEKRLTRRQLYSLQKKNDENFHDFLKYKNFEISSKKRGKKKKIYASLEEEIRIKKENEVKRRLLMAKNLQEKTKGAIDRILNLRDNKKIMKNNNFNKKKKIRKFFDEKKIFFKFFSGKNGNFLDFKNNFFFEVKKIDKKFFCGNCGKEGRYKIPISLVGFCGVDCYKVLKKRGCE